MLMSDHQAEPLWRAGPPRGERVRNGVINEAGGLSQTWARTQPSKPHTFTQGSNDVLLALFPYGRGRQNSHQTALSSGSSGAAAFGTRRHSRPGIQFEQRWERRMKVRNGSHWMTSILYTLSSCHPRSHDTRKLTTCDWDTEEAPTTAQRVRKVLQKPS